jgi:geranylgeranyl pyrophosphate synthase
MVQDAEVVKLIAEVLREMVHGEVIQAKAKPQELLSFDHYL